MKIDGNRLNLEAAATTRTEAAQTARGRDAAAIASSSDDRVALSSEAATASRAIHAAAQAPDVRMDVVEQVRAKLLAGEVGTDLQALADRMVDAMIEP
jgi:flagellar biosynthesis anti-sigma factor FlgM